MKRVRNEEERKGCSWHMVIFFYCANIHSFFFIFLQCVSIGCPTEKMFLINLQETTFLFTFVWNYLFNEKKCVMIAHDMTAKYVSNKICSKCFLCKQRAETLLQPNCLRYSLFNIAASVFSLSPQKQIEVFAFVTSSTEIVCRQRTTLSLTHIAPFLHQQEIILFSANCVLLLLSAFAMRIVVSHWICTHIIFDCVCICNSRWFDSALYLYFDPITR